MNRLSARTLSLLGVVMLLCADPCGGDTPPSPAAPDSSARTSSVFDPSFALEQAEELYLAGIRAYLAADPDGAAEQFRSVLHLLDLAAGRLDTLEAGVDQPREVLARKAGYLLGKVTGNGENDFLWVDLDLLGAPPAEGRPPVPEVEIVYDEDTAHWESYFSEQAHDRFATYLARSGRYEALMRGILRENGLPENLVHLAMIESGFNPRAYSVAQACGIWQFIHSTGERCGLRIDYWVDERRNPEKSCQAAARYLRELWNIFESWPLAMAAYNAGEKRVMDAVLAAGTRDFSRLRLPRQTREYVPRFMAAARIAANPKAYGFDVVYEPPLAYEVFEVDQATDLATVARCCEVSEEVLKDLNPHLRRACTPPDEKGYPVRIPVGTLETCQRNFFRIPTEQRLAQETQVLTHSVRRGETLSHIAARYGTTVSAIVAANHLRSTHLIRVGQKLTVPTPGSHYTPPPAAGPAEFEDGQKIVYVVRRGDTLDGIARSHRTRVEDLRKWNSLGSRQHLIHPGDRLLILPGRKS